MNDMEFFITSILFFGLFRGIYMVQLPENWIRCNLTDPKLNDCMKQATMSALSQLRNEGLASLGVSRLEPLEAGGVSIDDGGDLVHLKVNLTNFKIYGATQFTIKDFQFNVSDFRIKLRLCVPNITCVGRYKMRGSAVYLPLTGEGRFEVAMYDSEQVHDIQQSVVQKNGKRYLHVDSYKITNNPLDIKIYFEKLFSSDTMLADTGGSFLHWRGIYDEAVPTLTRTFNNIYKFIYNNFIDYVSLEELFY